MRKILGIYGGPRPHWVGDGFPVRSLFSHASHGEHVSPFLLLDYAGPARFEPTDQPRGVGVHPHKGFETVTIVYEGEVEHRDSTGRGGVIGPGDVQWMTAAGGILHEEFHSKDFTRMGGTLKMVQLWVNLPARDKAATPGYQALLARDIPSVPLTDGAGTLRVIAGDYQGRKGPARTFTPIDVWDVSLSRGKPIELELPDGHTLAAVVLKGSVLFNNDTVASEAQFALFDRKGGTITLEAQSDAQILILSGEPIDEPVVMHGPFVMNTADEIRQAITEFQNGRFGAIAENA
ncbi:pirin family protein [Nordella sp. HKS 07]|uniref:pirin family protein n=1 Tax=Nordella sp. HKS 07 TaxID=2712222 RepID=UPI0013E10E11|nr:pirin family protein [Nordella sp. HKS 07]QIG51548.1 pirin family protein [Nordella sp. HKS 07]